MSEPILSICIPTYNRSECLEKTLNSIVTQSIFLNSYDVEIVISNNCSDDNTNEICTRFKNLFPDKIKYIKQKKPILADIHIFKTIEYAKGKFCKLSNDTFEYSENALEKIVTLLKNNENEDGFFFYNKEPDVDGYTIKCETFNDFIKTVSYNSTWIGGFCIKKEVFDKLENPLRRVDLQLSQLDIYGRLFENSYSVSVYINYLFIGNAPKDKGGNYNFAQVFCENYFTILYNFVGKNNGISKKIINKDKRKVFKFISFFYFSPEKRNLYKRTGFLKYTFKYYFLKPYFYKFYIVQKIKDIMEFLPLLPRRH